MFLKGGGNETKVNKLPKDRPYELTDANMSMSSTGMFEANNLWRLMNASKVKVGRGPLKMSSKFRRKALMSPNPENASGFAVDAELEFVEVLAGMGGD